MPEKHPPEQLLQALWCLPVATEFQTTIGEQLRVEFPGWLNSGAGPDFLEARLYQAINSFMVLSNSIPTLGFGRCMDTPTTQPTNR